MRTTPTAAMETILSIPPLQLAVNVEATLTAYRLQEVKSTHGPRLDKTKIMKELSENMTLKMRSDYTKDYHPERKFEVIIPTREEWQNKKYPGKRKGTVWYTDGAKNQNGTGAGIYGGRHRNKQISLSLGSHATVFQAEIAAIECCSSRQNTSGTPKGGPITILSDSQAALRALKAPLVRSKLVKSCINSLETLAKNNKVQLIWVPKDQKITGNLEADRLAKMGANGTFIGPEPTIGISYETARVTIRKKAITIHNKMWNKSQGMRHSKLFLTDPCQGTKQNVPNMGSKDIRRLTGLTTGHCKLKKHLHRMGIASDPLCRGCLEEEETPEHLLRECEAFCSARKDHFGKAKLTKPELYKIPWKKLLDFSEETELF